MKRSFPAIRAKSSRRTEYSLILPFLLCQPWARVVVVNVHVVEPQMHRVLVNGLVGVAVVAAAKDLPVFEQPGEATQ
jgi:hypothetical protein